MPFSKEMYNPDSSTEAEINSTITRVAANKEAWTKVPPKERLVFLKKMQVALDLNYEDWAASSAKGHGYDAKDIANQGHLVGELYAKGPAMLGNWINSTIYAYECLRDHGKMPPALATRTTADGKKAVQVYPKDLKEKLANDMRGELVVDATAGQENPMEKPGGLVGILSAGNFDGPTDCMTALFVENHVVVCKPNPVNHHSARQVQAVFQCLIDAGYIGFVFGGVAPGKALIESPLVDRLLMTGASQSYDRIMWGPPEEQEERKKNDDPVCKKKFDAELGCVSPYIICPGKWSEKELDIHAHQLVACKMFNNGHICASPQVVITAKKLAATGSVPEACTGALGAAPGDPALLPQLCSVVRKTPRGHGREDASVQKSCPV